MIFFEEENDVIMKKLSSVLDTNTLDILNIQYRQDVDGKIYPVTYREKNIPVISKKITIDNSSRLIKKYGGRYTALNYQEIVTYFTDFNEQNLENISKAYCTMCYSYNAIDNYNKTESYTKETNGTESYENYTEKTENETTHSGNVVETTKEDKSNTLSFENRESENEKINTMNGKKHVKTIYNGTENTVNDKSGKEENENIKNGTIKNEKLSEGKEKEENVHNKSSMNSTDYVLDTIDKNSKTFEDRKDTDTQSFTGYSEKNTTSFTGRQDKTVKTFSERNDDTQTFVEGENNEPFYEKENSKNSEKGSEKNTENNTTIKTLDNSTQTDTTTNNFSKDGNVLNYLNENYENKTYGNIGITTTQRMLTEEQNIALYDFIEKWFYNIIKNFTIVH